MIAEERMQTILQLLEQRRTVSVASLCQATGASEATIRRDLSELDRQGKLCKVHGGATLPQNEFESQEPDVTVKAQLNVEQKDRIARYAADVIEHSGYFKEGFSMQTGSGAAATAATRFMEAKMERHGIKARFALGGITGSLVDLHEKGLIEKLLDTQCFDGEAAASLRRNPDHVEISTNVYANPGGKAASCDQLDVVILSALEIDVDFNVNVITGSDGVMRGASGGHCDVAAAANLTIVVAPLLRSRIPTVVKRVTTRLTPGESIDVLVTDHGIAVNPARPEIRERLLAAGLKIVGIDTLWQRAISLTGEPKPIAFTDRIVGVIRYRDGSVIDVVHQVKEENL